MPAPFIAADTVLAPSTMIVDRAHLDRLETGEQVGS
jgi:hypothetical protein